MARPPSPIPKPWRRWLTRVSAETKVARQWAGPAVVVAVVVLFAAKPGWGNGLTGIEALLLLLVAASAVVGGWRSGLASAALLVVAMVAGAWTGSPPWSQLPVASLAPAALVMAGLVGWLRWRLDQAEKQRRRQALTDTMTGLGNQRAFEKSAERELMRAERTGSPLSMVIFDIDNFKAINDTQGHTIGDRVLLAIAHCCSVVRRRIDTLARYGGDEFVLLLPETDLQGARIVAERLRQRIAALKIPGEGGGMVMVTCSFGVASRDSSVNDPKALLRRADMALYEAKRRGRNAVVVDESVLPDPLF